MLKTVTTSMVIALIVLGTGCCAPCVGERDVPGYGGVYSAYHCGDCDDCSDGKPIPYSLREGLRNIRRSLVCGGGCGEVYYGEWRNYPPDCPDPCDECANFNGPSCYKCLPRTRIWNLLALLKGQRFCDPCADCDPCGSHCDDCSSGDPLFEGEYIESGEVIPSKVPSASGCDCGALHVPAPVSKAPAREAIQRLRSASRRNVKLTSHETPTPAKRSPGETPGQRFSRQTSYEDAPIIR